MNHLDRLILIYFKTNVEHISSSEEGHLSIGRKEYLTPREIKTLMEESR